MAPDQQLYNSYIAPSWQLEAMKSGLRLMAAFLPRKLRISAGLLAYLISNTFPDILFQWYTIEIFYRFTAAGTAPVLHRIPF